MGKLKTTVIIIDDDITINEGPLFIELGLEFESVLFFPDPVEGLKYIHSNLGGRMLVLLDLSFPQNNPNGDKILESIRKLSFLVPVIIWSGVDEDKDVYTSLINNRAFAYLTKNASSEEIIAKLKEANNNINNDVSIALEEWIISHSDEQKEKPYILTIDGKHLSLNDILNEIRLQSDIGKDFSKNLSKLTIDLLTRNKEKFDD
jgi:DNA-binding NarL/FixJ family response regulator